MKQLIPSLVGILIIFASCQNESTSPNEFLNQDNLPSQFFTIDNSEDTTLYSKSGVRIGIEKDIFETTEAVEIEFKEALTMEDIVLGGLRTITISGEPLASSGMTFIQATSASGAEVALKTGKTIEITIPETGVRPDNKIFEGVDENGQIVWVEKAPVNATAQLSDIEKGEALFKNNCASCHSMNMKDDMTGPALGNVTKYRDWDWIKRFTRNSQGVIASGDTTAICLYNQYNQSVMTAFPNLTDKEIEQLYAFIENTAILNNVPIDSSRFEINCNRREMKIIGWNLDFIEGEIPSEEARNPTALSTVFSTDLNWMNIDRFLNDSRVQPLEFWVEVDDNDLEDINVFIIFPNDKCYLSSLWHDKNKYSFTHGSHEKMTTLPVGDAAQVMVTAKQGDAAYFAVKEITYGDENIVKITPKEISKEKMLEEIKRIF